MVLHLPDSEGGYERQWLWFPKDDLRDSFSRSSSPLLLLRDIQVKLLTQDDCKEVCASTQSQVNVGAGARLCSQDDVSQQQKTVPLSLPRFTLLFEASFVRDKNSASNADIVSVPVQHKVTQQILIH
jgi:hypothetical protein